MPVPGMTELLLTHLDDSPKTVFNLLRLFLLWTWPASLYTHGRLLVDTVSRLFSDCSVTSCCLVIFIFKMHSTTHRSSSTLHMGLTDCVRQRQVE